MTTTMAHLQGSPMMSSSRRRMDYFPPITFPATMYQRRKKKSARELYHLSPPNHDLILQNPPVTPWDEPPEFFRTFIDTPDNLRRSAELKATWPFLRQIGPKCVYRGLLRRTKEGGGDAFDYHKDPNYRAKSKHSQSRGNGGTRFLEPECIGISRGCANSQESAMFSPPFAHFQISSGLRRNIESSHSREISESLRAELTSGKVNAPPPSETRSAKSDDSLPDTRHPCPTPVEGTNLPGNDLVPRGSKERSNGKLSRSAARAKFVRFEELPTPSRLFNSDVESPQSQEKINMCKLTWRDIVQARVTRTRLPGDEESLLRASESAEPAEEIAESEQIAWRLPRSTTTITAAAAGRGLTVNMRNVDKRLSTESSAQNISSWIDDVKRAQGYSISR